MSQFKDLKHDVAIIGMSMMDLRHCNNRDSNDEEISGTATSTLDVKQFPQFLEGEQISHTLVPQDGWSPKALPGGRPEIPRIAQGNLFPKIDARDFEEFGVSTEEAASISPASYLVMREAFNGLLDSGINYRGQRVGVFVSTSGVKKGSASALVANRISTVLDLTGPSVSIDTDESTSSRAMHLAMQSIRVRDCDIAVVCAVDLVTNIDETATLGALAPDGISKPFEASSDGYVHDDAIVVVVIKRQSLAISDGDRIYSTVLGSSGEFKGMRSGISTEALSNVISEAYNDAKVDPKNVDFADLYGASTLVDNKTEVEFGHDVFKGRDMRPLRFACGESDPASGNGEAGAFLTALVKCSLILYKGAVFPNGFHSQKISIITQSRSPRFEISSKVDKLIPAAGVANHGIASASGHGIGGTYGRFILRSHLITREEPNLPQDNGPFLYVVGGLSSQSTKYLTDFYKENHQEGNQKTLATFISQRARQMSWRSFAVGDNISTVAFPLPAPNPHSCQGPILAVFSGQGPQSPCMGRSLFKRYAVFRESIMRSDEIIVAYKDKSFLQDTQLFVSDSPPGLNTWPWSTKILTMSIIFFQIALYDLMLSFGVKPDLIIGHSMGEVAAMYASGALTHEAVIQCVSASADAFETADGQGALAAVNCSPKRATEICTSINEQHPDTARLSIGCYNSPGSVAVAGSPFGIAELLAATAKNGIPAIQLHVRIAVHSDFVDSCKSRYLKDLRAIFKGRKEKLLPVIPVISTVTGEEIDEPYSPEYFWKNIRQPVLFTHAVTKAIRKFPNLTCIEFAPNPVLGRYVKEMGAMQVFGTVVRSDSPEAEFKVFLENLGKMTVRGINCLDFSMLNGCSNNGDILPCPTYPFKTPQNNPLLDIMTGEHPPGLLPPATKGLHIITSLTAPQAAQHVIEGQEMVPSATYLEMALGLPGVRGLHDVRFLEPCIIPTTSYSPSPAIQVTVENNTFLIHSSARAIKPGRGLRKITALQAKTSRNMETPFNSLHCSGEFDNSKPDLSGIIAKVDVPAVLKRCNYHLKGHDIYQRWEERRHYREEFRRIKKMSLNKRESITEIRGELGSQKDFVFDPILAETVFQVVLGFGMLENVNGPAAGNLMLPHSLDRCFRNDGLQEPLTLPDVFKVYSKKIVWSPESIVIDLYVLGSSGEVIFTLLGLQYRREARLNQSLSVNRRFTITLTNYGVPPSTKENIILPCSSTEVADSNIFRLLDHAAINSTKIFVLGSDTDIARLAGRLFGIYTERRMFISWCRRIASKHSIPMARIVERLPPRAQRLMPLLKTIGDNQQRMALDPTRAQDMLFGGTTLNEVWSGAPFKGGVFVRSVQEFKNLVKGYGGSKVVRVLEINAGHGSLTKALGRAIKEAISESPKLEVEYYCTDPNFNLAERAARASTSKFIFPAILDINADLASQGIPRVDIVVGLDVFRIIPDLTAGLESLRTTLYPGGCLMLIELDRRVKEDTVPGVIWLDYVFGGLNHWFSFPLPDEGQAAILGKKSIKKTFQESGFLEPYFIEMENPKHVCHRTLIAKMPRPSDPKVRKFSNARPLPQVLVNLAETTKGKGLPTIAEEPAEILPRAQWVDSYTYYYDFGQDSTMMKFLNSLDAMNPLKLYLYTSTHRANNNALIGISKTLRHEFPLWDIQLVIFDAAWGRTDQNNYIEQTLHHMPSPGHELYIGKDGNLRVSELRALNNVDRREALGNRPYAFRGDGEIWAHYPPAIGDNDLEIEVATLQLPDSGRNAFGFSGKVLHKGPKADIPIGASVIGISLVGPTASKVVCHWESVAERPAGCDHTTAATMVRSMAICELVYKIVMGSDYTEIQRDKRVLIHGGTSGLRLSTAVCLGRLLDHKGWIVYFTALAIDDEDIPLIGHSRYSSEDPSHFVRKVKEQHGIGCVISFTEDAAILAGSAEVLWDKPGLIILVEAEGSRNPITHLPGLKSKDTLIAVDPEERVRCKQHMVKAAVSHFSSEKYPQHIWEHEDNHVAIDVAAEDKAFQVLKAGVLRGTAAFNPRATYILVEGLCWLGLAMAKFIIEHGGSHIVISFRRDQSVLEGNPLGRERLIFDSLRQLPDVTVELARAEVEDVGSMRRLFQSQKFPIAGVLFFAPTFKDSAIEKKTQKMWDEVYSARAAGAKVLIDSLDVTKLDWMVLCSSLASIIGHPGQADICGAQTIVSAITARIPNCINVVLPPILDEDRLLFGQAEEAFSASRGKYNQFGMSTDNICKHILDAIWCNKVSNIYIPDIDWAELTLEVLPPKMSWLTQHLIIPEPAMPVPRPTVEATIAGVLSMSIGEVNDDLVLREQGLNTFLGIVLSSRLKEELGLEIHYTKLLTPGLTVRSLLALQAPKRSGLAEEPSVTTSGTGKKSGLDMDATEAISHTNSVTEGFPVFIIHIPGIAGDILFNWLASALPLPVYVLNKTADSPNSSIDKLAQFYVNKMLEIQSNGQFRLVSFSSGAAVAVEVAGLLLKTEHHVESLIFLDGAPTLLYTPSFAHFIQHRMLNEYWQDLIVDYLEDMIATDPTRKDLAANLRDARKFFNGNITSANDWVQSLMRTYRDSAVLLYNACTEALGRTRVLPWAELESAGTKIFLAKANRGVMTEPWVQEVPENWGLPIEKLKMHEFDSGQCEMLARNSGLAQVLMGFWGLEMRSDKTEGENEGYEGGMELEGDQGGGEVELEVLGEARVEVEIDWNGGSGDNAGVGAGVGGAGN